MLAPTTSKNKYSGYHKMFFMSKGKRSVLIIWFGLKIHKVMELTVDKETTLGAFYSTLWLPTYNLRLSSKSCCIQSYPGVWPSGGRYHPRYLRSINTWLTIAWLVADVLQSGLTQSLPRVFHFPERINDMTPGLHVNRKQHTWCLCNPD